MRRASSASSGLTRMTMLPKGSTSWASSVITADSMPPDSSKPCTTMASDSCCVANTSTRSGSACGLDAIILYPLVKCNANRLRDFLPLISLPIVQVGFDFQLPTYQLTQFLAKTIYLHQQREQNSRYRLHQPNLELLPRAAELFQV